MEAESSSLFIKACC